MNWFDLCTLRCELLVYLCICVSHNDTSPWHFPLVCICATNKLDFAASTKWDIFSFVTSKHLEYLNEFSLNLNDKLHIPWLFSFYVDHGRNFRKKHKLSSIKIYQIKEFIIFRMKLALKIIPNNAFWFIFDLFRENSDTQIFFLSLLLRFILRRTAMICLKHFLIRNDGWFHFDLFKDLKWMSTNDFQNLRKCVLSMYFDVVHSS